MVNPPQSTTGSRTEFNGWATRMRSLIAVMPLTARTEILSRVTHAVREVKQVIYL
jgi:hypothetical protein